MEQKEPALTPPFLGEELILVDEEYLDMALGSEGDLYMQLVEEPSFVKQDSMKYDYSPYQKTYASNELSTHKTEKEENISKRVNEVNRGIKCNCTKTKCQKNYCDCFKAGLACSPECLCLECCNDEASRILLPRRNSGSGCKCQKSHCLKNYCECHSGGRKCSIECRCLDCHNTLAFLSELGDNAQNLSMPKKKVKKELLADELVISLLRQPEPEKDLI